ncbi:MAG TPA: BON domain-containing protein [Anaerolineaceae bacterium]|nr:BON domain-containing protein [Anaerolineaceae bacterium]
MAVRKAEKEQRKRPDDLILDDIWRAVLNEETIRAIDINDISIDVEYGQVFLNGHVLNDNSDQRIEALARSVPGVMNVHNHLVTDHDLRIQVAQALGEDERTRHFMLPVNCCHGWVELGGMVPNRQLQLAAEEVAGSVSTVRGVIMLPRIAGAEDSSDHRAVQPCIGARVYGANETEGNVTRVIINPHNRLVTHAVVRVSQTIDGRLEVCDYLVPVEAMQVVDMDGILLNPITPAIESFPRFIPAEYPFAPLTWQPPYPYRVGNVLWPRHELLLEKKE